MAHILTASSVKNGRDCTSKQNRPRTGTKIYEVYSLFQVNRGRIIRLTTGDADGTYKRIEYLRDNYGLDIRCIKRGCWILAGEWEDKTYIDYLAQDLKDVPG